MGQKVNYYHNENYAKRVGEVKLLTPEDQIEIINKNPDVREHMAALVLLFRDYNSHHIHIDDWECDLENHILEKVK